MAKLIIWQCYDPLVRISEGNVIVMSLDTRYDNTTQHDTTTRYEIDYTTLKLHYCFFLYLIITKMMVINGKTLSIHSSAVLKPRYTFMSLASRF